MLRQVIDEVMFEIRELSGQEYVDQLRHQEGRGAARPRWPRCRRSTAPNGNGHRPVETLDLTDTPRRSSADVLRSAQTPPPL